MACTYSQCQHIGTAHDQTTESGNVHRPLLMSCITHSTLTNITLEDLHKVLDSIFMTPQTSAVEGGLAGVVPHIYST